MARGMMACVFLARAVAEELQKWFRLGQRNWGGGGL